MWVHHYVSEKLRELNQGQDQLAKARFTAVRKAITGRPPARTRLVAFAGRAIRHLGETMEVWATPTTERERLRRTFATGTGDNRCESRRIR